jgi:DNA-binding IclR family transcriptional regulator
METAQALGRIGLLPASENGIGVALLAELDDEHIAELYEGEDVPGYPEGLDALLEVLATTRAQGYARVRVGENQDRHTIAIGVSSPAFAAIGMSGWIPEEATPEIVAALRKAAAEIAE